MGLFYQFPSHLDPTDERIVVDGDTLIVKTYGPPGIFWVYLMAIFSAIFFLYMASRRSLGAMLEGDDSINRILAISVLVLMGGLIPVMLGIFFYEKIISKQKHNMKITHRLFGISFKRSHWELESAHALEIVHCLDSPNVARREQQEGSRGFQNNGFYQLNAFVRGGGRLLVDRHSQSRELDKLKKLLCEH